MEGQFMDSNSGLSESSQLHHDKPKKIRSGINAKPMSSVQEQLHYPHFSLGQISGFINMNLQFHNLSYEQFVVGELVTINNSVNIAERHGWTALLQHISQVHNTYTHIIRRIENREISWDADWDSFERFIYDRVGNTSTQNQVKQETQKNCCKLSKI